MTTFPLDSNNDESSRLSIAANLSSSTPATINTNHGDTLTNLEVSPIQRAVETVRVTRPIHSPSQVEWRQVLGGGGALTTVGSSETTPNN